MVKELNCSGVTVANVKKARRKEIEMFWIALMTAVTVTYPFSQDLELGLAASIR